MKNSLSLSLMELASSSILSSKLSMNPIRWPVVPMELCPRRNPITARSATNRDGHDRDFGGSRLVDENMILLRKRMEEIRAAEHVDPDPPLDWMEWEKDYYAGGYGSDVCQVVGLIQVGLMSMRPSVAIGLLAMLISSIPASITLVGFHLVDALRSVLK